MCGHDMHLHLMPYLSGTVGLYLHLAVSVCHEIKLALGIYCFRFGNLLPYLTSLESDVSEDCLLFCCLTG
jgi:hypothetical protein